MINDQTLGWIGYNLYSRVPRPDYDYKSYLHNVQSETNMDTVRKFETGATRDTDATKPDFEGFLSPLVIARYAEYMHKNRVQNDGTLRASDNWTKGIPFEAYMKSGWRHFFAWWAYHRDAAGRRGYILEEALCGLLFNLSGYLHEYLKNKGYVPVLEWDGTRKGLYLDPNNCMLSEPQSVPKQDCVPVPSCPHCHKALSCGEAHLCGGR